MPNYYQYPNYIYPNYTKMETPQIQNGGFVTVRSENEAKNYPVAQGTSVTFKNETAPYIYTKTVGFSQLDIPLFEKYKLIKEEVSESQITPQTPSETFEPDNSALEELKSEIEAIWKEINRIKKPVPKKKEEGEKE